MKRIGLVLFISGFWLLVSGFSIYAQETLTLLTYYPAPYGVYQTLEVTRNDASTTLTISAYDTDPDTVNLTPIFIFRRADGTMATPATVDNTDILGSINFRGYDNDSFETGANIYAIADANWGATERGTQIRFQTRDGNGNLTDRMTISADGMVGIGTAAPDYQLQVDGSNASIKVNSPLNSGAAYLRLTEEWPSDYGAMVKYDSFYNRAEIGTLDNGIEYPAIYIPRASSNVGIGEINPTANLHVGGNIKANLNPGTGTYLLYDTDTKEICYYEEPPAIAPPADIAELFEANEEVEPGDVLVIDENGKLKKSSKPNDTKVAGIVSGTPALLLQGGTLGIGPKPFKFESGNKPPVALAGQVPVKTSAENGPIKPGDLLTTSPTPGYAMKAKPIGEINGYPIYPQGCIVGKALEGLKEGKGKILVLVCLM